MDTPKPTFDSIVGTIKSVKFLKSGISEKGKKWERFEVFVDDQKFTTFEKGYLDKIGEQGEWRFKEESFMGQDGRMHDSRTLLNLPLSIPKGLQEEPQPETPKPTTQLPSWAVKFGELEDKMDKILDIVQRLEMSETLLEPEK